MVDHRTPGSRVGWRTAAVAAVLAGVLGAGCETQDCPEPEASAIVVLHYSPAADSECVVSQVVPDPPYVLFTLMCDDEHIERLGVRTDPPAPLPFEVGQTIRVRSREDFSGSHVYKHLDVEDATTSRMLLRSHMYSDDDSPSADFEVLDLAPFSFGEVLACRPVPGPRGRVRLAFNVTFEDETIRLFDGGSGTVGDYTLWAEALDGRKEIVIMYTP